MTIQVHVLNGAKEDSGVCILKDIDLPGMHEYQEHEAARVYLGFVQHRQHDEQHSDQIETNPHSANKKLCRKPLENLVRVKR